MPERVVFVFPRTRYRTGDPPLGVAYLAAVLREARPELEVSVLDGTFLEGDADLLHRVEEARADVVGVFVDSLSAPLARQVGRVARRSGARTVAGGPAASVASAPLTDAFDVVVEGEAESRIVSVVDRLLGSQSLADVPAVAFRDGSGAVHATGGEYPRPDLETLPHPAWDLLDMDRYLRLWPYLDSVAIDLRGTNVLGSRGCPWKCSYCQPTLRTVFGKRVRQRSPASIAREIAELQDRYRIDGVFFHDDTITMNREWVFELCRALGELPRPVLWGCNSRADVLREDTIDAMVDAGMRGIHLGIEAGSRRVREEILDKDVDLGHLEAMVRHLRRRGVHPLGFFMLGSPTETLAEMVDTIRLARRLPLTEATFSLTAALPGTALHERLESNARFELRNGGPLDYYNRRNFVDTEQPLTTGGMSLRGLQLAGLAAFYLHPSRAAYLRRHLTTRQGIEKLAMKVARFVRLEWRP